MKTFSTILVVALAILTTTSMAQVRVSKGNIKVLKGQTQIAVEFTYNNMAVGKYKNEQDYVDKKVADLNKKEAGRGDKWHESWVNDRDTRFKPKFLELVSKYTAKKLGMQFSDSESDATYKFVINTDFLEPGFNAYVVKKYAMVRMTIKVIEISSGNEVCVVSAAGEGRTYGMGDLDTGTRIAEAYAKAGKDFGKYLSKKVK